MNIRIPTLAAVALFAVVQNAELTTAQRLPDKASAVHVADNGDGTFTNPVIHSDYSDPDVIRVGDDYYMTASSFNAVPGLPILHSRDLVNWRLVNHAIRKLTPLDVFSKPQHGGGVWAPALRFHNGEFFIFYGDPDHGIFMTKTKDPLGEWSEPLLIKKVKGWIDPCPLWDDDDNAYLVNAFAGSRAGIKSVLVVNRMSPDGTQLLDEGVMVFDGHQQHPTVEGPKFHKLNGYYYISAPAGGVATGWQLVLRSKNIYGPYEEKIVLAQGTTDVNGPHQGALVDTPTGEWWFIHFQDKGAYGRIVHLQPAVWRNGFPVVGDDKDGDGTGEPVGRHRKPVVGGNVAIATPPDSDEFERTSIGRQWQWHGNPDATWAFPYPSLGVLRMNSVDSESGINVLWDKPNLLLQKFPAEEFVASAKITLNSRFKGETFAFVVMGLDHSLIAVEERNGMLYVRRSTAIDADKEMPGDLGPAVLLSKNARAPFYLRVSVAKGAVSRFSYSTDNKTFTDLGQPFKAREGKWIGAKLGFVFIRPGKFNDAGTADIDWIRFTKPE